MLVSFEYEDFVSRINACADGNSEYSSKQTGLSCLCRSLWRKYRSHLNMNRSLLRACFVPWVKMLQVCQGMYGIIHSHVGYYACMHICDVTYSYVWHNSFLCMAWLIHMYDMTHSHWWHDSFIWVSRRIRMRVMTHSCACHDSLIAQVIKQQDVKGRSALHAAAQQVWVMAHDFKWVMAHTWVMVHTWMIHPLHVDGSWHTCEWFMPYVWMSHVTY